jgi:Stress responsive A/B Barrel Domain
VVGQLIEIEWSSPGERVSTIILAMFTHVVLFWMKPDAPANAAEQTKIDAKDLLAKIPTIKFFDVGHAAMTPRDVVDNTYHVGLLTVFEDTEGHDEYQIHPLHKEFIARNKNNWLRVAVYDFKGA